MAYYIWPQRNSYRVSSYDFDLNFLTKEIPYLRHGSRTNNNIFYIVFEFSTGQWIYPYNIFIPKIYKFSDLGFQICKTFLNSLLSNPENNSYYCWFYFRRAGQNNYWNKIPFIFFPRKLIIKGWGMIIK